ncbi:ATP-binding protein [Curtobacterium flaccumfaciens pv. oortii]|uniref:AAA family ATPase n=1 Tax=Curtobacterium flaccumfaciens TaxID=2035 RepID=UPI001BDE99E8|nr:AAA family ATPase [Curtobacterium flaccumfaciens]MBT1621184.1 ATP-binding protein [Curtobacterium flaccumfaciens pv. oortii]
MSSTLPDEIVDLFGDDPHPERSWRLLAPVDQDFVEQIALRSGTDPGRMTRADFLHLDADARRRRERRMQQWYQSWPYMRTGQYRLAERRIAALPEPKPGRAPDLLAAPFITGESGVGKTFFLKHVATRAITESAWNRRLDLEDGVVESDPTYRSTWRPVIWHSLQGNPTPKSLFRTLCSSLGVPTGDDPHASFATAAQRHGVRWIFLDEMQMVNYDGQYGRYLHDALKALQNQGFRLVMGGHNMRSVFRRQKTAAQNAARMQSEARWAFIDFSRYEHRTPQQVKEWRTLLGRLDDRLRLEGHEPGERVLSQQFEEYLWVSTLGYANSLATLVTDACIGAMRTPSQRITRALLDDGGVEDRVAQGRQERIRLWESGRLSWSTDWPAWAV